MMNEISAWFEAMGVHPVLGGALAGALLVLVLRAFMFRKDPADTTPSSQASRSATGAMFNKGVLNAGKSGIQVNRNGEITTLPDEVSAQIRLLLRDNRKIEAIKVLRGASGLGLYDAKVLVDSLEDSGSHQ